jgi:hypothetical protein
MLSYTRRELIGKALIAGAGATVLGDLEAAPGAAAVSIDGPVLDPHFLAGQLVTMTSRDELAFLDYDGRLRRARFGGESRVWKGGDWDTQHLATGDCVYATGLLGPAGVFELDKVWVAIDTVIGTVVDVSANSVILDGPNGPVEAQLTSETEFIGQDGKHARGVPVGGIRPLDDLLLVGFHTRDGLFTASRLIELDPNVDPSAAEIGPIIGEPRLVPTPAGPRTLCPYTWNGLSSFFCCGNVSGCTYTCGSSNDGWCGGQSGCQNHCRSDGHYAAWKSIYCGSNSTSAACGNCCDNTLTQVPCGQVMSLSNACSGQNDTVNIVDVGPNMRCVAAFGCQNRTAIKFDLTPCAFAAIGGNFNSGFTTCAGTIYLQC